MAHEYVYSLASSIWGAHPMDWPTPPRRRPYWWQFRKRKHFAGLEYVFVVLDNEALRRYWSEVQSGQSVYEDAGGYMLRCYAAMMGEATESPYTYQQAASDLVGGRHA